MFNRFNSTLGWFSSQSQQTYQNNMRTFSTKLWLCKHGKRYNTISFYTIYSVHICKLYTKLFLIIHIQKSLLFSYVQNIHFKCSLYRKTHRRELGLTNNQHFGFKITKQYIAHWLEYKWLFCSRLFNSFKHTYKQVIYL